MKDNANKVVEGINPVKWVHPRFLEYRCEYKRANYVFNPVLFEREDSFIKGASYGPQAILRASNVIEKYHIASDSKPYLAGFHTSDAYFANSEEDAVLKVEELVKKQIAEKKIAVTFLGDGSGSIGAYRAISDKHPNCSIVSLDAHLSMRETMNGTRLSRFCKMHQANICSDNVIQFGIGSMGNREKEKFHPDKVFFKEDVFEDKYWLEDVLSEVGNRAYLSIDMSIFDQGVISSDHPDSGGLTYKYVEKLLRSLSKKTKIVGIDVSGFVPSKENKGQSIVIAKLIYDLIGHIEQYS